MPSLSLGRFPAGLARARSSAVLRLGSLEVHAERWSRPVPFAVTHPGLGELVVDLHRWRLCLTHLRRRHPAS